MDSSLKANIGLINIGIIIHAIIGYYLLILIGAFLIIHFSRKYMMSQNENNTQNKNQHRN